MLKTITLDDIRSWEPCYDPAEVAPDGWEGTAIDVLDSGLAHNDKLWVVLRDEVMIPRLQRLFAVWCARRALALRDNPDPRSVAACDVAEHHANGKATDEELAAAWAAVRAAASDAAWAAASDTARAAAWAAARDAQVAKLKEMVLEEHRHEVEIL